MHFQPARGGEYSGGADSNRRRRTFKPAVKRAGLPITRPYDLLHACASPLIHAGWPLNKIADHLGNSVATLSAHYAHLIADMRDETVVAPSDAIVLARAQRAPQRVPSSVSQFTALKSRPAGS